MNGSTPWIKRRPKTNGSRYFVSWLMMKNSGWSSLAAWSEKSLTVFKGFTGPKRALLSEGLLETHCQPVTPQNEGLLPPGQAIPPPVPAGQP
jgi:hypothetical protein